MKKLFFKKILGFCIVFSSISVFFSCDGPENIDPGVTPEPPITEENYEKDDEGFFILDEEYLTYKENNSDDLIYSKTIEYDESTNLRLYESGNKIPLYLVKTNDSHTFTSNNYSRSDNSVGIISLLGEEAHFALQTNFTLYRGVTIRPLNKNVEYEIDQAKRLIYFTIKEPGQYTFEFRSNATLHLFVDENESYITDDKPNLIYFGEGIHNKDNDPRIDSNNMINVPSNTNVFVDMGAIIEGGFNLNNVSNVDIFGSGIVTGANFDRDAEKDTRLIPYEINFCTDVEVSGITTLDPAGWCYNIYFSNNITLRNIKIISSRANGDGVSVQSSSNVRVKDSFVRSWDDSLVVKNYPLWSNRNQEGETHNIYFENCLIWTDLAQSMEIGYETVGTIMENIYFTDITVLHAFHLPPISIHNGNNSNVQNVHYENIVIEDASVGKGNGRNSLIELTTTYSNDFSDKQKVTALGEINKIYFKNVEVIDGNDNLDIKILGCMDTRSAYYGSIHRINDVEFDNVKIKNEVLSSSYKNLEINEYVNGVTFK